MCYINESHRPHMSKLGQLEVSSNFDSQKVILDIPFTRNYEFFFFNSINHFLRVLSTKFFLVVFSTTIAGTSIFS